MADEIRNLPVKEAQRQLAAQLTPRNERGKGDVPAGRYAEARAELQRLAAKAK